MNEALKTGAKYALTAMVFLTSPLWILPFLVGMILLFLFLGMHDMLWGKE